MRKRRRKISGPCRVPIETGAERWGQPWKIRVPVLLTLISCLFFTLFFIFFNFYFLAFTDFRYNKLHAALGMEGRKPIKQNKQQKTAFLSKSSTL